MGSSSNIMAICKFYDFDHFCLGKPPTNCIYPKIGQLWFVLKDL